MPISPKGICSGSPLPRDAAAQPVEKVEAKRVDLYGTSRMYFLFSFRDSSIFVAVANMNLTHTCAYLLAQLEQLVSDVRDEHFSLPSEALSQSTIGQHIRHTLEFFTCFEKGFNTGTVNYDKRAHDRLIETDRAIALHAIGKIQQFIQTLDHDKALKLEVSYDRQAENFVTIDTNALRELIYNIEHVVHHMAIMKIGIREVAPYLTLPEDFGIASSTARHRSRSAEARPS